MSEMKIAEGLITIRKRRRWFWVATLGGQLLVIVLSAISWRLAPDAVLTLFTLFAAAWVVSCQILSWRLTSMLCPRCGGYFHRNPRFPCWWWAGNIFVRKCWKCGLPLRGHDASHASSGA